jgi:hypothetical protein
MRGVLVVVCVAVLAPGCFLDRAGLVGGDRDAGRGDDASMSVDAFVPREDAGRDCVPRAEVCDGVDNDCDGVIDDLGPCDSGDADSCEDDLLICNGATPRCQDDGDDTDELEVCDGLDNDCDGDIGDDGVDDPRNGACDGDGDTDECREGTFQCIDGSPSCNDATDSTSEGECNGDDDDCDGRIDEGASCPCTHVAREDGNAYLFCNGGSSRNWWDSRGECSDEGYTLARIESEEEQRFIAENVPDDGQYWIAATDDDAYTSEGTWVWYDMPSPRTAIGYTNWAPGQPDDGGSGEHCAELSRGRNGVSSGSMAPTPGGWNDEECWRSRGFVCEAAP